MVRTKVFVGNLSFQTQEAELAAEFGKAGKVISANIITRGPRSLGYGFVEMDSEEDAHSAVKVMSKKEINGREINVEIAKPQDESKVRQPRPKVEGEAPRRRPRRRGPKKELPEGTQPVRSQKREVNEGKEEGEGNEEERPRRPRNKRPRGRGTPGQRKVETEENREESKTTLFVANLPFSLDDEGFAKVITDLSLKLKTAHVVKKRNGRSKGYGFVEFDTQEDQQKALAALNKKVVDARELSVKIALTEIRRDEPQEEKKEAKPAEKKAAPAEKKSSPAPSEKKVVPAEKKASPALTEKKASPAPAEKKASPAPAPQEKKTTPAAAPAEKKVVPAEKKVATPEKKATPPAEKKVATPEKKDEKK